MAAEAASQIIAHIEMHNMKKMNASECSQTRKWKSVFQLTHLPLRRIPVSSVHISLKEFTRKARAHVVSLIESLQSSPNHLEDHVQAAFDVFWRNIIDCLAKKGLSFAVTKRPIQETIFENILLSDEVVNVVVSGPPDGTVLMENTPVGSAEYKNKNFLINNFRTAQFIGPATQLCIYIKSEIESILRRIFEFPFSVKIKYPGILSNGCEIIFLLAKYDGQKIFNMANSSWFYSESVTLAKKNVDQIIYMLYVYINFSLENLSRNYQSFNLKI
jgi:hypothetical protein